MKLFAVYIGGSTATSNVELHDMRFSVGESIEDCHQDLRAQWWGTPESLHLDAWGALESADGYNVELKSEPYSGEERLYFINLGGYDPEQFTELHKNVFVVAPNESKAKVKALKQILDWKDHHKDYLYEVENMMSLSALTQEKNLHVHLAKTDNPAPFVFKCRYEPIGKKS